VHFILDSARAAELEQRWQRYNSGTELRLVECFDRQLGRAAQLLVAQVKDDYPEATVTVLLPRRMYSALAGRLLHDRTADMLARVISRVPGASAQIVAYDIGSRVARALEAGAGERPGPSSDSCGKAQAATPAV
jgi:hypothetical protein